MTDGPAAAHPQAPVAAHPTPAAHGWTGNAISAALLAADHVELWLPGALAALVFLGWIPFVLAIGGLPTVGDLGFFVSSVVLSPSFPLNAILLGVGSALSVVAASIVIVTGETALMRGIDELRRGARARRALDEDAARAWFIALVAAIPSLGALIVLGLAVAAVAPGEYQSPDLGTPLVLRILVDVWPSLAALLVLAVIGQSFAAGAQRASVVGRRGLAVALAAAAVDLVRHPVRRLGTAVATTIVLVGWLALSWALLHVLWASLDGAIGQGGLLQGASPVLLVGFVAIWLCLVAVGGALASWASAWWSLEVTDQWS